MIYEQDNYIFCVNYGYKTIVAVTYDNDIF